MRTLIFTKVVNPLERSRLIFVGDIQFQLRAGDLIEVLEGFCVEPIDRVYYSIPDNQQEVHLKTTDSNAEYPTVKENDIV